MPARDPSSVDYEPIDLEPVARRRAAEWTPRFHAKAIRFEAELDPVRVHANAATIAQAIDALLSNAWRYSDARTEVRLIIGPHDGRARIEVIDNGIGIDDADLPHVRERFFRSDRTRSRAIGGSGLGLALVTDIASAHAGWVELDSTVGEGTQVRLWMPLAASHDARNESCKTDTT